MQDAQGIPKITKMNIACHVLLQLLPVVFGHAAKCHVGVFCVQTVSPSGHIRLNLKLSFFRQNAGAICRASHLFLMTACFVPHCFPQVCNIEKKRRKKIKIKDVVQHD